MLPFVFFAFRSLNSDNVVKLYGTGLARYMDNVFPLLVMEYCDKTLDQIIYDPIQYKAPGNLKDRTCTDAAKYAYEIGTGLTAIHHLDFVHPDLKAETILVCKNKPFYSLIL